MQTRQTPNQLPAGWDGEGLSFSEVVQKRQALLDERPALRAAYFASSDPLTFYTADDVTNAQAFRNYENMLFGGADFIWTSNLDLDNGVLCRATIEAP